jgi:hypothetical protein
MFVEKIVGEQLSSVEFVQDYVQLHFDGPTLTLFVWPVVAVDKQETHFGESSYRDVLCSRIAHIVTKVTMADDEALSVQFDDGSAITVSLKPEGRTVPEAGHFRGSSNPRDPLLVF